MRFVHFSSQIAMGYSITTIGVFDLLLGSLKSLGPVYSATKAREVTTDDISWLCQCSCWGDGLIRARLPVTPLPGKARPLKNALGLCHAQRPRSCWSSPGSGSRYQALRSPGLPNHCMTLPDKLTLVYFLYLNLYFILIYFDV